MKRSPSPQSQSFKAPPATTHATDAYVCVAPGRADDPLLGDGADILKDTRASRQTTPKINGFQSTPSTGVDETDTLKAKVHAVVLATMAVGGCTIIRAVKMGEGKERFGWCGLGWLRLTTASGEVLMKPMPEGTKPANLVAHEKLPLFVGGGPVWHKANVAQWILLGIEETAPKMAKLAAGTSIQLLGNPLTDSWHNTRFLCVLGGYCTTATPATHHSPAATLMTRQKIDGWKQLRLLNKVIDFKGQDAGIADRFNRPGHDSTQAVVVESALSTQGGGYQKIVKVVRKIEPDTPFELRKCSNILEFPVPSKGDQAQALANIIQSSCRMLPATYSGTFSVNFWDLHPAQRESHPLPPSTPMSSHGGPALPFFCTTDRHFCIFVNGPEHHLEVVYSARGGSNGAGKTVKKFMAALVKNIMIVTGKFGLDADKCGDVLSNFSAAEHKQKEGRKDIELKEAGSTSGLVRHQYAHKAPANAAATGPANCISQIAILPYMRGAEQSVGGEVNTALMKETTRDLLHSSLSLSHHGNIYKLPLLIGHTTR